MVFGITLRERTDSVFFFLSSFISRHPFQHPQDLNLLFHDLCILLLDVVSAYKSLAKEKEALEASLAALSTPATATPKEGKPAAGTADLANGETADPVGSADPLGANPVRSCLLTLKL